MVMLFCSCKDNTVESNKLVGTVWRKSFVEKSNSYYQLNFVSDTQVNLSIYDNSKLTLVESKSYQISGNSVVFTYNSNSWTGTLTDNELEYFIGTGSIVVGYLFTKQ